MTEKDIKFLKKRGYGVSRLGDEIRALRKSIGNIILNKVEQVREIEKVRHRELDREERFLLGCLKDQRRQLRTWAEAWTARVGAL